MDKKFLVVSFESQTKKIAVQEMSYDTVLNVVKDRFGITNHNIKYFDTDVDEWVDLERDSEEFLKDCKVLKVKVLQSFTEKENELHGVEYGDLPAVPSSSKGRSTQRPSSHTRSVSPSRPNTPKSRPVTPVSMSTSPESRPATPVSRPITPTSGVSASCSQHSR